LCVGSYRAFVAGLVADPTPSVLATLVLCFGVGVGLICIIIIIITIIIIIINLTLLWWCGARRPRVSCGEHKSWQVWAVAEEGGDFAFVRAGGGLVCCICNLSQAS